MLLLDSIAVQFGARILFDDCTALIRPRDRIGLVGANGAGKSTLLKVIAGLQTPDEGDIHKAGYVTTGYLPQDGIVAQGSTLYREVETAFEDIMTLQAELDDVQRILEQADPESDEHAEAVEIAGELHHKLEDLDVFRMKSKIEKVLMGLGFAVSDFDRQTEEFSGGWQMRIALAKLLLREPSVLLLDEPTNHLDIESQQWLEDYIKQYNGAVVLVSHDRAFLDTICTRTLAIVHRAVEEYAGNYSFYEVEREVRKQHTEAAYRNQQQQLKQTREFIERFRYKATKARQVQSRIKQLEKMEIVEPEEGEEEIHLSFPPAPPPGRIVLDCRGVYKRYGAVEVFEDLNCQIERGDRIAVVGVNGAGKSTFARIAAGVEPATAGEIIPGHNVIRSYFAQHQAEELDPHKSALDIVDDIAVGEIRTKLRGILGMFLFHGDDVFKKVAVLSGGEKSRLALAKMLLQPSNVLIMDEPTNHLDMKSKKVLQEALNEYEGTMLIVSHDRSFLDPLVTKVMEVRKGGIRFYLGNVTEYLRKKAEEKNAGVPAAKAEQNTGGVSAKERKRIEAEERQRRHKVLLPFKKKLDETERAVDTLEKRKKELEAHMASPDFYRKGDEAKALSQEFRTVEQQLAEALARWEQAADEYSKAEESA